MYEEMPACRNPNCIKGRFDFPRLQYASCDRKNPDVRFQCPVCSHKFDGELNDLTISSHQKLNPTVEAHAKYLYENTKIKQKDIAAILKRPASTIYMLRYRNGWKRDDK